MIKAFRGDWDGAGASDPVNTYRDMLTAYLLLVPDLIRGIGASVLGGRPGNRVRAYGNG